MAPTVVSASVGVLGPLVVKLAGLLAGEYGRLKGVRRDILALKLELSSMHAAVQKYTMLEDPDIQVKQWISMVRELAYDIEDSIDKFIHRLGNGGRHGGFKEFFRKTARRLKTLGARRGIAGQIQELKARIKQVKELKNSYKLDDATCSASNLAAVDPRLSAVFTEEQRLVGIDGPRDDLVKWMLEEGNSSSKRRRVLSIVGFGGLGKTTMANEICRKIKRHFACLAFVSVSQKPDINKIIKDVISQVSYQDGSAEATTDNWDERKSIAKLRELLKDERYLIIIDDIWSTQAWNIIECAFPDNNYSSRIIATTRIIDVANSCCSSTDDRKYEMIALSDLHSKQLFFKRIFGSGDCCPDMMIEVSNEVLKKCGGLPLAIISISGLLANKPVVKEEWEKVKRSIGSAMENNRSLEGMTSILSLSYTDLTPNLKTCLMYLSVFPEDYLIMRERLVRRWIAEGFVSEERGQSQYEVAMSYFYELINKSMIQPVHIGLDGKVNACRVHDMMLEIIITKSREDNFVTVVGGGQTSLSKQHGIIRRLSVQYINQELAFELAKEDLSHVRSLTVTTSESIKHLPNLVEFEALRVLDFEGCIGFDQYDMNSVDKLFQLKYIGLRDTDITRLPSQIVTLSDLETLDFRDTSVQELPAGFAKLTKLRHLLTDGRKINIPVGIGLMRNLRVISGFNATSSPIDALEELGNLTSLSGLSVYLECGGSKCGGPDVYRTHEEKLFSSLLKLISSNKLKSLWIYNVDGHSLECMESWSPMPSALQMFHVSSNNRAGPAKSRALQISGPCAPAQVAHVWGPGLSNNYLRKVPKWIEPSHASLSSLDINLTELTEDDMQTLGELPTLLELVLTLKTGQERITVQGTGFPSLKSFDFSSSKGACIMFMRGAMPRLEELDLNHAASLERNYGFYIGIVHLPCLRHVFVRVKRWDATNSEISAVVAAMKEEETAHTNHPTVIIIYNQ